VVTVWIILTGETLARFVTASGRTQALLTLRGTDVRAVRDDDLLSVRPARRQGAA